MYIYFLIYAIHIKYKILWCLMMESQFKLHNVFSFKFVPHQYQTPSILTDYIAKIPTPKTVSLSMNNQNTTISVVQLYKLISTSIHK